jgi:hypothetical protein
MIQDRGAILRETSKSKQNKANILRWIGPFFFDMKDSLMMAHWCQNMWKIPKGKGKGKAIPLKARTG